MNCYNKQHQSGSSNGGSTKRQCHVYDPDLDGLKNVVRARRREGSQHLVKGEQDMSKLRARIEEQKGHVQGVGGFA